MTGSHENGWPCWLTTWNHLGSHYPFHREGQDRFHMNIAAALDGMPGDRREIDPVAVVEILSKHYCWGDRTLVCGLRRSPWMSRPDGHGGWKQTGIPRHGRAKPSFNEGAARLKDALRHEALGYLAGRRSAGILLSGGLDSRIVAGTVRELQLSGEYAGKVVALTWGLEESRDVAYARDIARRYGWEWVHFPLGAEVLAENIEVAGTMGAEFSPLHLHALPHIRNLDGVDVILAGSYGDGVGRAEFSGRRIGRLKPFVPWTLNRFGLIKDAIVRTSRAQALQDAYGYRKHILRSSEHQYRELELEMHYMRRMLQACMTHVAERIPLFQLFTAPETFSLMWDLDPAIRDDGFYKALLPTLPGGIGSLPWARTGQPLGAMTVPADHGTKLYHAYGRWLRRDLCAMITRLVASDTIKGLNLFNERALDRFIKLWPKADTITSNCIDETVSWMASLAIFTERYGIRSVDPAPGNWHDTVNALFKVGRAWTYRAVRERFRE